MTDFRIPAANWSDELAAALKRAQAGDRIIVRTEPMRVLAVEAAERMSKAGVVIEIAEILDA